MQTIFDPYQKNQAVHEGRNVGGWKEVEKAAVALRNRVVEERKARGEKFPEIVPVVHRATGELRHFNFQSNYPGALNHAESCLNGQWRFADAEEERAAFVANEEQRQAATREKMNKAAAEVAQKIMSAVSTHSINTPTPIAPQSVEQPKSKTK